MKKIKVSNSISLRDFITWDYIFDFIKDNSFFDKSSYREDRQEMKYITQIIQHSIINLPFQDEKSGSYYISLSANPFKKYF